MPHRHRHIAALVGAFACAGLVGCGHERNARLTIGTYDVIETVRFDTPPTERATPDDAPSLTHGLDRSHWAAHEFVVPIDGVAHQPTYTFDVRPPDAHLSHRARGDYPSPTDALDERGDAAMQLMHMAVMPFVAGLELATFPVRAVITPPWTQTQSPPAE